MSKGNIHHRTVTDFAPEWATFDLTDLDSGERQRQDIRYSSGVLHQFPDIARAMRHGIRKLRPGAPFLVRPYYNFRNRPGWFRATWRASDLFCRAVAPRLFAPKKAITTALATAVYWPLSGAAALLQLVGVDVSNVPLCAYRDRTFRLRTDALDRIGTRLGQRFSTVDGWRMIEVAELDSLEFGSNEPYWTACGRRAVGSQPARG